MQNSGRWDPWLPVVKNSRLFAQRTVRPLTHAPVTQACGHSHNSQYIVLPCCTAAQTRPVLNDWGRGRGAVQEACGHQVTWHTDGGEFIHAGMGGTRGMVALKEAPSSMPHDQDLGTTCVNPATPPPFQEQH